MSHNLKMFFDSVRESVFGGSMSQEQVDGVQRIIEYRDEKWPLMNDAELAYILATAEWETGHSLQPVEEGYPLTGKELRDYQKRLWYYPAYGRGLVQTTHPPNYARLGLDKPGDYHKALEWGYALQFLFEGCIKGWFTGKKLSDYITATRQDYKNARRVVNGTDQADHIAKNARAFHAALLKAADVPVVSKPPMPAPAPPPAPTPAPAPAGPSLWERIAAALDKLAVQPPAPAPSPAPTAAPSPELIAVANRIEQRQIQMLEMLTDKFATYDAKLDAIKARMDDLHARLAAKDAEVAAAIGTMTPEQAAEIAAANARADEIANKLDALAAS